MLQTYTMNLFNDLWDEPALKDRAYDLLSDLSDYVDDQMIERVADFIEELEQEYSDQVEELEQDLKYSEETCERLEKEVVDLEEQLYEKEKLTDEVISKNGKEVDLESKEFKNLTGYSKARKELLDSVKKLQGVSDKKRIYLPKGAIKMVVFNGLEYVEELRLTSKEFQEYIRNNKDKGYNYRLELMGKLNCKTKIDWCD